jgi:hypothetical protein
MFECTRGDSDFYTHHSIPYVKEANSLIKKQNEKQAFFNHRTDLVLYK